MKEEKCEICNGRPWHYGVSIGGHIEYWCAACTTEFTKPTSIN